MRDAVHGDVETDGDGKKDEDEKLLDANSSHVDVNTDHHGPIT